MLLQIQGWHFTVAEPKFYVNADMISGAERLEDWKGNTHPFAIAEVLPG